MRVLIVDEDAVRGEGLARRLRAEGHHVGRLASARDLPDAVLTEGTHLVVLWVGAMPFHALLDTCCLLRHETAPLLLLVGEATVSASMAATLEAGADAFLVTPISEAELVAQAHALLRRHPLNVLGQGLGMVPVSEAWQLDLAGQRLVGPSREVPLSRQEFRLLAYLVRHEGAVVTREALLNAVWGMDYEGSSREVDVYVRYVRRKIELEPSRPRRLLSVWGRGYRFEGPRRRAA